MGSPVNMKSTMLMTVLMAALGLPQNAVESAGFGIQIGEFTEKSLANGTVYIVDHYRIQIVGFQLASSVSRFSEEVQLNRFPLKFLVYSPQNISPQTEVNGKLYERRTVDPDGLEEELVQLNEIPLDSYPQTLVMEFDKRINLTAYGWFGVIYTQGTQDTFVAAIKYSQPQIRESKILSEGIRTLLFKDDGRPGETEYNVGSGQIEALDDRTIIIHNFSFDGNAAPGEVILFRTCKIDQSIRNATVRVSVDPYSLDFIGIFCYAYSVDFGHTKFESPLIRGRDLLPPYIPPVAGYVSDLPSCDTTSVEGRRPFV